SKLGLQPPTSARNIVAGILGRKIHIDLARYFNFFAFEVLGKRDLTSEVKKIEFLYRNRFNVPKHSLIHSPVELTNFLEMVKNEMANGDVGCDGAVFTINDSTRHQALGFTNHHPKYKLSFKWQGQTAVSKVIRVDWATSKFGIVTPVAIIDPVVLSGATITNVTLHNASYVRSLDLKAGDKIEIVRSGEVIPKFLKIIERSVGDIDIPKVCPSCRSILVEDEVRLRCSNAQNCPAQLSGTILNWINAVGIDDLSEKRLLAMIEIGIVSDIPSLYKISIDDILKLPATKDKMASKIFANIQKSKNMPLSVFLHGLGIEGIGLSTWEKIVERFGSIDKVKSACEDDLLAIDGIASKTALQIISGIQKNTHLIHQLFSVGVLITENSRVERIGTQIFDNMNFVITGTLSKPRKDIENLIKSLGGKITSSVTKNTNVLITNDTETQSSKMQMASKLSIPIWTEFEFFQKTET
ncbi:MAG: helix-hairpin-helix domain-containing protein, partial [Proteobacteria bacterium]|nr:helix-hairpin-helix domain-containing protein [Pseudomonadota bacterium]